MNPILLREVQHGRMLASTKYKLLVHLKIDAYVARAIGLKLRDGNAAASYGEEGEEAMQNVDPDTIPTAVWKQSGSKPDGRNLEVSWTAARMSRRTSEQKRSEA